MAVWFLGDAGQQVMGGALTASSLLTTVTSGAANTVGSYAQMHAAAPFPVSGFRLHLGKTGVAVAASNRQFMFDIGIGPNGTETVIIQDVAFGGALAYTSWDFPFTLPVGTRIAVRTRALTGLSSTTMGMWLYGGGSGMEAGCRATTYGAVTTGSRGTVLTAPTSANTIEAAWTVITAATTAPMRFLVIGLGSPNTTTSTAADLLVDIGVGAAGAEAAIVSDIACAVSVNEDINYAHPLVFPVNVPVGSRLVARYRGTSTVTTASPNLTLTGIS